MGGRVKQSLIGEQAPFRANVNLIFSNPPSQASSCSESWQVPFEESGTFMARSTTFVELDTVVETGLN